MVIAIAEYYDTIIESTILIVSIVMYCFGIPYDIITILLSTLSIITNLIKGDVNMDSMVCVGCNGCFGVPIA